MSYQPIPSLDCRYEINLTGTVRNVRTKRTLKPSGKKCYANLHAVYRFFFDGSEKVRTVDSLMWEVHGIEPPKPFARAPVRIILRKDGFRYSQPSLRQAAIFLARKLSYSASNIRYYLSNRRAEIHGWQITYLESEKRTFPQRNVLHHKHKGE